MSLDKRALDRYLTRETDYYDDEPPVYKCGACGKFLPTEPEGQREFWLIKRCTGTATVLTCTYDRDQDAAILQIIGDEYHGKTYEVAYPPDCGGAGVQRIVHNDGDIDPKNAESYRHEPHWYVPEWGYQVAEMRECACGHINEEVLV